MNKIWLDNNKIKYNFNNNIIVENNKLIINEDSVIDVELNNYKDNVIVEINDANVIINVLGDNNSCNINYLINNSELLVQKLVINNNDKVSINLNSPNSKIVYKYSAINYTSNKYHIDVYHNSPNTESVVVNHGVNVLDKKLVFDVYGYIPKDSINTICNQDNKIINIKNYNKSVIRPNLIIDNNMIEANHSAYIGKFKDQDLFYLQSRGLSKKVCYDLLIKAYLIGHFELEDNKKYLEKIKNIGGEIDE